MVFSPVPQERSVTMASVSPRPCVLLISFPVQRCQLLQQLPQAPPPSGVRPARSAAAGLHGLLAARRMHARSGGLSGAAAGRLPLALAPWP